MVNPEMITNSIAKLDRLLEQMVNGAKTNPQLRAELFALHNYMATIFKMSKIAAKIPLPSKVKTQKEIELSQRMRRSYYFQMEAIINKMPAIFRTQTGLKVAFDEVVMAANALAKVTPSQNVKYQSIFNRAMAIFVNTAMATMVKNIKQLDFVFRGNVTTRTLAKLRAELKKILNICSSISGKSIYADMQLTEVTPEMAIATAGVAMTLVGIVVVVAQAISVVLVPHTAANLEEGRIIFMLAVIPGVIGSLLTLKGMLTALGYKVY